MLNQRVSAAQGVANELFPAEEALEEALLRTSKVAIAVIEGRRHAKLPFATGQEGLAKAHAAAALLIAARAELGAAHAAFREAQEEIGLRAVSFGDLRECPPASGQASGLSIVKSSEAA